MLENYEGLQFSEVKQQICSFCSFSLGKQKILEKLPSFNRLTVEVNNKRLKQAINMAVSYGGMPFGGIYDVSNEVIFASKDGTLNCDELLKIAAQAYGIGQISKYVQNCNCEKKEIEELVNSLTSYQTTATQINKCISAAGELYDNASNYLANVRKKIKSLQKNIAVKYNDYINRNSSLLQEGIVASRNGRNVVLVKNTYKNSVEGLQYGSSASNSATYIEPSAFIGINNELQQALQDERNEIKRILHNLSQLVKNDAPGYLANVETLGLLDSLFASALWAKQKNATVGEISKNDLIIKNARHPLIDSSKVVSNTYRMISPVRIILITGPNTGGKTVSLKIIGLFSLMFLCGLPLCCDEAEIPIFDNIFYDIGDGQSIDDDLSTFSSHISNIARITSKATTKSLVIFDELGSATDPIEGQAIAGAVLDYCRKKQIYVVATTHFAKLKAYGKQYNDIMISSVEFDQEKLKPTYKYKENTIGSSNAIEIAKRYGLNEEIISTAYQMKEQQATEDDKLIEKLQDELNQIRKEQQDVVELKIKLQEKEKELNKRIAKTNAEKEKILEQAQIQSDQIVQQAQTEADEIVEKLKEMQNYDINAVAKLKHQLNQAQEKFSITDDEELISNESIQVNDYVKVKLTNQTGQVISLDKKAAVINCDGVKMKVSLNNLVKTERPIVKVQNTKIKRGFNKSFSIECNLIGMHVEDALDKLDKYLDEALLANVPFVRIIHGVGTGALRNAVWEKLKKTKFVKKFEHGTPAEGSTGATIVYFKEKK
ncbi:MAG: Smr/MutS family protein [Erysipelotrichia bacterium]|nr:Smr/MutS family protein [Erysipelotrichia bacterium]